MALREAGTILDGKYEVLRSLGTGGMGEVYLVRHLHLEEQRVVKVLRQEVAADPAHRQRFVREARLATQIKHPNVAILYDFAQLPEGSFYMVWEYVEGREVGQWLHEEGPFPIPLAIDLAIQALRGLEAIHSLGVIHRDLSPDNLMISPDPRGRLRLKIIDLGLAKTLAPDPDFEVTQAGAFLGKLRYCSPEQAESAGGENLDRRSDLYSFALVLYEMICGASPFDNGERPVFVFQRLAQDPKPMVGRVAGIEVPAALDRVVRKALGRDRADRYADAIGFIEALERVRQGLGEHATQRVAMPGAAVPGVAVPGVAAAERPRTRSRSGELSAADRQALLAQIERAAPRVRESSQVVEPAQAAEPTEPAGHDRRTDEAEARPARLAELERLLAGYIKNKQLPLAELAFDSLLELDPDHRLQGDYLTWIEMLRGEVAADRQVAELLAAGRAALERDDHKAARKSLEAVRKLGADDERAAAFATEIESAVDARRTGAEQESRRRRFDEHLAKKRIAEAAEELAALERLGATRVSLDVLGRRLDEARRRTDAGARAEEQEQRFRERLDAGDFAAARDAARGVERELPASPRPGQLLAEVARREQDQHRRQSIAQGELQVEELIRKGHADQAALALKILLRIDPKNRNRKQFERQLKALGK